MRKFLIGGIVIGITVTICGVVLYKALTPDYLNDFDDFEWFEDEEEE